MEITTVKHLREVIKTPKIKIVIQPKFGVSKRWVKISKDDALALIGGWPDETEPWELELTSERFGVFNANHSELYLG